MAGQLNSVVSSLKFFPSTSEQLEAVAAHSSYSIDLLLAGKEKPIDPSHRRRLPETLENYVRLLIEQCAYRVIIPAMPEPFWARPNQITGSLSRSLRSRIEFVDRRSRIWKALEQYLEPVANENASNELRDATNDLAGYVYRFVLAAKRQAEVPMRPSRVIRTIVQVSGLVGDRSEAQARLSILRGMFELYSTPVEILGLRLRPSVGPHSVLERVDEILEDAYLQDASALRRSLSVGANVASVKRALRKLVPFIVRNRPWAQGLVDVASQIVHPGVPLQVADKSLSALADMLPPGHGPTLVVPFQVSGPSLKVNRGLGGEVGVFVGADLPDEPW
jgi:hypothetical protein